MNYIIELLKDQNFLTFISVIITSLFSMIAIIISTKVYKRLKSRKLDISINPIASFTHQFCMSKIIFNDFNILNSGGSSIDISKIICCIISEKEEILKMKSMIPNKIIDIEKDINYESIEFNDVNKFLQSTEDKFLIVFDELEKNLTEKWNKKSNSELESGKYIYADNIPWNNFFKFMESNKKFYSGLNKMLIIIYDKNCPEKPILKGYTFNISETKYNYLYKDINEHKSGWGIINRSEDENYFGSINVILCEINNEKEINTLFKQISKLNTININT